jgi:hypothetical protein
MLQVIEKLWAGNGRLRPTPVVGGDAKITWRTWSRSLWLWQGDPIVVYLDMSERAVVKAA